MAGTSAKDIKNRIKSIENTGQITKAMELVAASKLIKAKETAEATKGFFEILNNTLSDIKNNNKDNTTAFTEKRVVKKTCYIVIGGDRGMAGGYNVNLFKRAMDEIKKGDSIVFPIGKKANEYFSKQNLELINTSYEIADEVNISDCYAIGNLLTKSYIDKKFDRLVIVYTVFESMLSQIPDSKEVLPLAVEEKSRSKQLTIYEPDAETVFESIVPQYIAGMLYASICESLASEFAARRTAMESASKNAKEMIDDLTLKFNRARQASITQEITEIVSGAEPV